MGTEITGTNKERYDKTIRRREKLATYFYDMSKATFTTVVLTNFGALIIGITNINVFVGFSGLVLTILLAWYGNRIMIY